jgi:hypothetical protein
MAQQALDRAKIACPPIDQHRLCSPQRVRSEFRRIKTDAGPRLLYEARVLPRGQTAFTVAATSEQELTWLAASQPQIIVDRLSRLVCQFEANRPAGLFLANSGSINCVSARRHVVDMESDDIAAAQHAVDGPIEEGMIPLFALNL